MLQIKTIAEFNTQKFDDKVNHAIQQGWRLVRRYRTPDNFFVAELERQEITEEERCCGNCSHFIDSPAAEPCASCSETCSNWEGKR